MRGERCRRKSLLISLACFPATLTLCNVVYGVAEWRGAGVACHHLSSVARLATYYSPLGSVRGPCVCLCVGERERVGGRGGWSVGSSRITMHPSWPRLGRFFCPALGSSLYHLSHGHSATFVLLYFFYLLSSSFFPDLKFGISWYFRLSSPYVPPFSFLCLYGYMCVPSRSSCTPLAPHLVPVLCASSSPAPAREQGN